MEPAKSRHSFESAEISVLQVGHHPVLPDCCTTVEVCVTRLHCDLAVIVDAIRDTQNVSRQSAEILQSVCFSPKEPMEFCVTDQIGLSNNLTLVINGVARFP